MDTVFPSIFITDSLDAAYLDVLQHTAGDVHGNVHANKETTHLCDMAGVLSQS